MIFLYRVIVYVCESFRVNTFVAIYFFKTKETTSNRGILKRKKNELKQKENKTRGIDYIGLCFR